MSRRVTLTIPSSGPGASRRSPVGAAARFALCALASIGPLSVSTALAKAGEAALLVKVLDRPEPAWWQTGDAGAAGSLHRTLAAALVRQGVPVLAPRDPGPDALPQQRSAPDDAAAAELARRMDATWAIVGAAQAQRLGSPTGLDLSAVKVELSVRLLHAERGRLAGTLLAGRAWAAEEPVARQQASERVAERLALWAAEQIASAQPPPERSTEGLRVRGVATAAELRELVRQLRSRAGVFWLAGAAEGEVVLTSRGPLPEPDVLAELLAAPPFDRYGVSVSREGAGVVVELSDPRGGPPLAPAPLAPQPPVGD